MVVHYDLIKQGCVCAVCGCHDGYAVTVCFFSQKRFLRTILHLLFIQMYPRLSGSQFISVYFVDLFFFLGGDLQILMKEIRVQLFGSCPGFPHSRINLKQSLQVVG